jgi:hypothetical protein
MVVMESVSLGLWKAVLKAASEAECEQVLGWRWRTRYWACIGQMRSLAPVCALEDASWGLWKEVLIGVRRRVCGSWYSAGQHSMLRLFSSSDWRR